MMQTGDSPESLLMDYFADKGGHTYNRNQSFLELTYIAHSNEVLRKYTRRECVIF